MSKVTIEQALSLAGVMLLAREAGEAVEGMTHTYIREKYPEESLDIVITIFEAIKDLAKVDPNTLAPSPLEAAIDNIMKGFKE